MAIQSPKNKSHSPLADSDDHKCNRIIIALTHATRESDEEIDMCYVVHFVN